MRQLIKNNKNLLIIFALAGLILSQTWYFYQQSRYDDLSIRFTSYESGLLDSPRENINTIKVTDPHTNKTVTYHRPDYLLYSLAGIAGSLVLALILLSLINRRMFKREKGKGERRKEKGKRKKGKEEEA